MALVGLFKGKGPNGFGYNSTSDEVTTGLDLTGRTYLLTGCSSGLGEDTLRVLSARGATVIGTARDERKAKAACAPFPKAIPVVCELSEPESVRGAVAAVRALDCPLDGIIANAGVMALPQRQVKHGLELQFLTNHVGHFILTTGLLDRLAPDGRVVALSSSGHKITWSEGIRFDDLAAERGYTSWQAYGQSKLANLLFARQLATRLPTGQTANAVHPGVIATNLTRHSVGASVQTLYRSVGPLLMSKSVSQGSATQCLVAAHPDAATVSGRYWADCNPATPSRFGQDDAMAAALWEKTEEIVAGLG